MLIGRFLFQDFEVLGHLLLSPRRGVAVITDAAQYHSRSLTCQPRGPMVARTARSPVDRTHPPDNSLRRPLGPHYAKYTTSTASCGRIRLAHPNRARRTRGDGC